jgi:hypothetical protein
MGSANAGREAPDDAARTPPPPHARKISLAPAGSPAALRTSARRSGRGDAGAGAGAMRSLGAEPAGAGEPGAAAPAEAAAGSGGKFNFRLNLSGPVAGWPGGSGCVGG